MTPYLTLAEARSELKAVNTTEDAKLLENIRQASIRLDNLFYQRRPLFAPFIETRQFILDPSRVNSMDGTFDLSAYLLSLTSVTVGGEAVSGVEGYPDLQSPITTLRLTDSGQSWYSFCNASAAPQTVKVTGIWGFNRDYANAWLAVDIASAIATTTVTSFTIADVNGADDYGRTPRISAGAFIKIDSEFMEVISTVVGTNTVNVKRGVNGSTAATHLVNAPVYVWQVEEPVKRALQRQAAFMYARRGAYENGTMTDVGLVQFSADILAEVYGMVQGYAYG